MRAWDEMHQGGRQSIIKLGTLNLLALKIYHTADRERHEGTISAKRLDGQKIKMIGTLQTFTEIKQMSMLGNLMQTASKNNFKQRRQCI